MRETCGPTPTTARPPNINISSRRRRRPPSAAPSTMPGWKPPARSTGQSRNTTSRLTTPTPPHHLFSHRAVLKAPTCLDPSNQSRLEATTRPDRAENRNRNDSTRTTTPTTQQIPKRQDGTNRVGTTRRTRPVRAGGASCVTCIAPRTTHSTARQHRKQAPRHRPNQSDRTATQTARQHQHPAPTLVNK